MNKKIHSPPHSQSFTIVTVLVARTLFKNGKIFLVDIFHGNKELADAVNSLLLTGFYLINIGYAISTIRIFEMVINTRELIEILSIKIGAIVLILGCMHFLNMFIFFRLRKRALADKAINGQVSCPVSQ